MSHCKKCGGSGWIRDMTWCGKECCPEWLRCLVCNKEAS